MKIHSRQHEGELQTGQSKRSFGNAEQYNREEWAQTADQEMQMQLNEADAALVQDGHWGRGISILGDFQDLTIKPQQRWTCTGLCLLSVGGWTSSSPEATYNKHSSFAVNVIMKPKTFYNIKKKKKNLNEEF